MKIIFSKKCFEFEQAGHPESPQRLKRCYELLKSKDFKFIEPSSCSEEDILRVHSAKLLQEVKSGEFYDPDTPAFSNIFEYAALSAGAAILASELSIKFGVSISLMRPPGHHATRDCLGGFCYFNNIAIAVEKMRGEGRRIAIIDFDCHHGNGTEDIFKGAEDIIYLSLHQSPLYPGTGLESDKNCYNFPLAAGTEEAEYLSVFNNALKITSDFNPDLIAVSAGFDTYARDPLGGIKLDKTSYRIIGELIAKLGKPKFCVLEGGYSKDLSICLFEFLSGISRSQ
ncbi:MAG: histone deacetylase [Candidatus Omnitrophica bacterium]|nr:histone deacetylase [Candidatus Omnitrophota bacterium]